jgi:hypothetical protein
MTTSTSCTIAAGLLMTGLFPLVAPDSDIKKVLHNNQLKVYEKVVKERAGIYIAGSILGLALAILLKPKNHCMFITISMGVAILYYLLSPKSIWMLNHLTTREQIDFWTKKYKSMQQTYYWLFAVGLLLGVII